MTGLTDRAGETPPSAPGPVGEAQRAWEAAMLAQVDRLRAELSQRDPQDAAQRIAAQWDGVSLRFSYWGREVVIEWARLEPVWADGAAGCSPFDTAMLLYHLRTSDGTPPAGTWISFRELPDGAFYHLSFTGYTGQRWAAAFGTRPEAFAAAAERLGGEPIVGLAPHAYRFVPLPRIPLAAVLWPGDEELHAQAAVLFDAHAGHHLPTDGLALLGSGLTGRLLRADSQGAGGRGSTFPSPSPPETPVPLPS
jgi:hypothetical protein